MTRGAYLEIGKLVKVDLNHVRGVALGDCLDALSTFLHLRVTGAVEQGVGEVECSVELLVLVGKVHRSGEGNGLVWAFEVRDGEVGGQFESALLVVIGQRRYVGSSLEECAALEFDGHGNCVLCCDVDCPSCLYFVLTGLL